MNEDPSAPEPEKSQESRPEGLRLTERDLVDSFGSIKVKIAGQIEELCLDELTAVGGGNQPPSFVVEAYLSYEIHSVS